MRRRPRSEGGGLWSWALPLALATDLAHELLGVVAPLEGSDVDERPAVGAHGHGDLPTPTGEFEALWLLGREGQAQTFGGLAKVLPRPAQDLLGRLVALRFIVDGAVAALSQALEELLGFAMAVGGDDTDRVGLPRIDAHDQVAFRVRKEQAIRLARNEGHPTRGFLAKVQHGPAPDLSNR